MVKSLQDCCLACIARNFSSYQRLGNYLSSIHKEILLERMCSRGLFTKPNLPVISYALFSHTLQRINLCFSPDVDDKCLELLGNSGCHPMSITIDNCRNVTDKGVALLVRIMKKMEEFFLIKLRQLTGEGLKNLSSRSLKQFSLRESSGITEAGVTAFIRNCPNIEKLCVAELHKVSDATLICAAQVLGDKLLELDASDLNLVTSVGTSALAAHCSNLNTVSFESDVKLDGSGLIRLAECCPISSLAISFCYKVSVQQVEIIVSMLRAKGTLQSFEAMGVTLSPIGLELLASTASLTRLSLCGVLLVNDDIVKTVTRSLGKVLQSLDLSNCTITDESCRSIAQHCSCLEELDLKNIRQITGVPLRRLFLDKERAKNIRTVTLSGSREIHSNVVEILVTNCPNLEILTMAGLGDITDTIALSIAHHCPAIQQISIRNCSVTDVGVCEIAVHCSQLTMLAMAGVHSLTDKCIIALAENCPYIEELYLSGCVKITKQAVTYLKDCAVNRVFVNHNNPSAPVGLVMAKDIDTGVYSRVDDLKFDSLEFLPKPPKRGGRRPKR